MIHTTKAVRVLFLRTPTTGHWLDSLDLHHQGMSGRIQIDRKLYIPSDIPLAFTRDVRRLPSDVQVFQTHESFQDNLQDMVKDETRYDVIAMDTYHDYIISLYDFRTSTQLLSDKGVLISHDCSPESEEVCCPRYRQGPWCGTTFMAFTRVIHECDPPCLYTILDTDTGIGIFTRTRSSLDGSQLQMVLKETRKGSSEDHEQKKCLELFSSELTTRDRLPKTFEYFKTHGHHFMNLVQYTKDMLEIHP